MIHRLREHQGFRRVQPAEGEAAIEQEGDVAVRLQVYILVL